MTKGQKLNQDPTLEIDGPLEPGYRDILTPDALAFVGELTLEFEPRLCDLLESRRARQVRLDSGEQLDFLPETESIRTASWTVAPIVDDLRDRRVEITGPVDRKMIINALNSGANVFMADFEDSNAPTWKNLVEGQINVRDAVARNIEWTSPEGKTYRLNDNVATLMVRPRGLHLPEVHVRCDGAAVPAAFVDYGLFMFHNARALLSRGSGPYFYLPKLESHLEARLWNDIFTRSEAMLGIAHGSIRATVLIETLPAAFEMDEILWELRDYSAGLNCGRWDYIFSSIKTRRADASYVLPDRSQVTMDQPNMRAYTQLLVKTCHQRGIHAMGGMAAQIPVKGDSEANERAIARVRADKHREARDGHDGTWVAHPALVSVAREIFDAHVSGPNQIDRQRDDVVVTASQLLAVPKGFLSEDGVRQNVRIGIQYLEAWLGGLGCVPLYHLMEDAATAEIARAQVWQWIHHRAELEDGRQLTPGLLRSILSDELQHITQELGPRRLTSGRFSSATELFEQLVLADELADFFTLVAYRNLVSDTNGRQQQQEDSSEASDTLKIVKTEASAGHVSLASTASDTGDFLHERWNGVVRTYSINDVEKLRGSVPIAYTLAERGATKLWQLLRDESYIHALGAVTGNQATQQVRAGLRAIYVSGWQVAADGNLAGQTYPDQSLYPANSVPAMVRRINQALQRADQIEHAEGDTKRDWYVPIVADAEAGFGGPLNAFELMKAMIEAGAAAVHFEDQLASEKKCGHLGGKVLVPTSQFVRTLMAARLAADVMNVPTILIARTDADAASLLTSDIDPVDRAFVTGERTSEGFFHVRSGLEAAITRACSYAPYADVLWCETSTPDLEQARMFAEAVHCRFPGKMLAYNCSPSFNWERRLDSNTIARFQSELAAMGYRFQFVTLAGFHSLNLGMYELALGYRDRGMTAYSELQQREFSAEATGYTATKHQREVGTGYFDLVTQALSGNTCSTLAMAGSTEAAQFEHPEAHPLRATGSE